MYRLLWGQLKRACLESSYCSPENWLSSYTWGTSENVDRLANICAISQPKQSTVRRAAEQEGEAGAATPAWWGLLRQKAMRLVSRLQLTVPLAGASPLSFFSSFSTSTSFFSFSSYKIKACPIMWRSVKSLFWSATRSSWIKVKKIHLLYLW